MARVKLKEGGGYVWREWDDVPNGAIVGCDEASHSTEAYCKHLYSASSALNLDGLHWISGPNTYKWRDLDPDELEVCK